MIDFWGCAIGMLIILLEINRLWIQINKYILVYKRSQYVYANIYCFSNMTQKKNDVFGHVFYFSND